ncbi:kinase-like domain-containing protein [Chiua virens]|nr:kinase-like domain-containing protein [Chiua virens]
MKAGTHTNAQVPYTPSRFTKRKMYNGVMTKIHLASTGIWKKRPCARFRSITGPCLDWMPSMTPATCTSYSTMSQGARYAISSARKGLYRKRARDFTTSTSSVPWDIYTTILGWSIVISSQKPFLIRENGYLCLAGMGSAKPAHATYDWHIVGKPAYAAPELFLDGIDVDYGIDWWSSGVILYEMLTQTLPFPGETVHDVLTCIREGFQRNKLIGFEWPENMNVGGTELDVFVSELLVQNPMERLGCVRGVIAEPWLVNTPGMNVNTILLQDPLAPWTPADGPLTQQKLALPSQDSIPGLRIAHEKNLLKKVKSDRVAQPGA